MNIMKPSNINQRTHQPRLLKDFLIDESFSAVGSHLTIQNNAGEKQPPLPIKTTISAFHAIVNSLKNIQFLKSSSRRRRNTICGGEDDHRQINEPHMITIKDIIRWKSFRDLSGDHDDDKFPPPSSPQYQCTTTTTSTSTATNSPRSSSSWCESDFTSEDLPCWEDGKSEENEKGEKCSRRVGEEKAEAVGPIKKDPISVMEITFEEEWWNSSFDQSIDRINLEKRMVTPRKFAITDENNDSIGELLFVEEEVMEENAMLLLNHVKEESERRLIADLVREEVARSRDIDGRVKREEEMVKRVKEWINGGDKLWIGWDQKDVCVREIEKEYGTKVEEEQKEIAMEVQNEIVDVLVDELLLQLICSGANTEIRY